MRRFGALRGGLGLVLVLGAAALLAGCAAPEGAPSGTTAGSIGSLTVQDVVARPGPAGGIGGAFLTIVNSGPTSDRLVSARTPVAPTTELHETIDDNGVMKMRAAPGGWDVPAKGRLELKPGGKHMMFVDLTSPVAAGSEIEITLVFEKAGALTIKAPVKQ